MSAQRTEIEEHSLSPEFANFLANNYEDRFAIETRQDDDMQPPYIVAYHKFNEFHSKLKDAMDILYAATQKFPQLPFAIAESSEFCKWTRTEQDYIKVYSRPIIFGVDKKRRYHRFRNMLQLEKLVEFCEHLLADELFKSEPLPTNSTLVKTAVALNIQEIVVENPKDVFITFYLPWCRFAEELQPVFDEVAKILQRNGDDKHIDLVRMNCETNFVCETWKISVSPMCYYIKCNDKENPIRYNVGPRTIGNLLKFIAMNATHDLRSESSEL